jgi:uncharacterized membrane protein
VRRERADVNVAEPERWVSALGGGLLTAFGLSRGNLAGLGLAALGGALLHRGLTGHCHLYDALGVDTARERHGAAASVAAGHGVKIEKSITINKSPEELYQFWSRFENLPRVMRNLESVASTGAGRSHWVAKGPFGSRFEWDAEVINQKPNELIAWRSLEGSEVDTAGSVHFVRAPGGRGTEVRVSLKYDPPAGKAGAALAKLLGSSPGGEVEEDLRRFKRLMECGELPSTEGQPRGRC